jgi:hypothetical protein
VRGALRWLYERRGIVAAAVAVWVVLKLLRGAVGLGWAFREVIPWSGVGTWLETHWYVGLAALVAAFALAFVAARYALGWAGRRWGGAEERAEPPPPPRDTPGMTSGDPLAARSTYPEPR